MANEEILELQIRDNAAIAASGLSSLATSLDKIKSAIGKGLRLTSTVNALERLKVAVTTGLSEDSVARFERLASTLERLKGVGALKITGLKNIANQLNGTEIMQNVDQTMSGVENAVDRGMETVEARTADASTQIEKPFGTLRNVMSSVMNNIKSTASHIKSSLSSIGKTSFSGIQKSFKDLVSSAKSVGSAISGMLGTFLRIAKYRFIRSVIKNITEAFSTGIKNVYHYSQAVNGEFAPAMDSAASSLATMKNAIGAQVAPLLQSLIPLLNSVVNGFIEVVNWVNQFISLMRGQKTWTRAIPQTVKAFEDEKKAAKGASKALKELLADWDELNIIQSETGGSGSGSAKAAQDYLHMFEEVSNYDNKIKNITDFIQDHMEDTLKVVKDIGLAILGWRLSTLFTGSLATLATLGLIGLTVKLSADITTLWDEAYVESNNAGNLLGDAVTTGALAGIALKLGKAGFGTAVGELAASLVLAVSAGSTFAVASSSAKTRSQYHMLVLTGAIKSGIAAALATAGFIAAGASTALAIAGGVITVALTTFITYELKMAAKEAEDAKTMAMRAFSETGDGGIKASEYLEALQEEFKKQTAGSKLVLDAYVEVPTLNDELTKAAEKISAFNSIIFHGEGKFTKEDADEFARNWGIVLDTLNKLKSATYDTILEGLTAALSSKSEELRKSAEEIRTTFIMLEKNMNEEDAKIYKEMEEISSRLGTDKEREGDLEQYTKLYHVFAAATSSGLTEIEDALNKGKTIDFGDESTAVQNAQEFIKSVGESANSAIEEENKALEDIRESLNMRRRTTQSKYENDLIGEEEYMKRMAAFDEIERVATEYANEKAEAIGEAVQRAYDIAFEQALSTPESNKEAYWKNVLIPLMKEAKEAGFDIPESVTKAFQDGVTENYLDFGLVDDEFIKKLIEEGVEDPKEIANALTAGVESRFRAAGELYGENLGEVGKYLKWWAGQNPGDYALTETQIEARDLLEIEGWDYLTDEWKAKFIQSIREAFGDDVAKAVMKELNISDEAAEWLMNIDMSSFAKQFMIPNDYNPEPSNAQVINGNDYLGTALRYLFLSPFGAESNNDKSVIQNMQESPVWNGVKALVTNQGIDDIVKLIPGLNEKLEEMKQFDIDAVNEGEIEQAIEKVTLVRDYYDKINKLLDESGLHRSDLIDAVMLVNDLYQNMDEAGLESLLHYFEQYGIKEGFDAWDFYNATTGKNNKINSPQTQMYIASMGGKLGRYTPAGDNQYSPYFVYPTTGMNSEDDSIADDVETGTKAANSEQNQILTTISNSLVQLLAKQWTVNIVPTSAMGMMGNKATAMANRISGQG